MMDKQLCLAHSPPIMSLNTSQPFTFQKNMKFGQVDPLMECGSSSHVEKQVGKRFVLHGVEIVVAMLWGLV